MSHVTCVMPTTAERRWCVPWAIEYFLDQSYEDIDLLVVGDGDDHLRDLLPSHRQITYVHLGEKRPLGQKYNECVGLARGPYVALWADDDWHAPWRINYTMGQLLAKEGGEIAGLRKMIFHRTGTHSTWFYSYPYPGPYFLGGSLVFHKNYWKRHRFDSSRKRHADTSFTNDIAAEEYERVAVVLDDPEFYVAINHATNTGRSQDPIPDDRWSAFPTDELARIMGGAWERYSPLEE